LAKIIVVTSGKGGVGKTTTSSSISSGLALRGHKTAVIDFDIGLRNLDLIMNVERRVVYDFVNVINGEASLKQALIKDKRTENLFILPASQTRDKDALTAEGVERVLNELAEMGFEYIICDSPAGIEHGAFMALYFADEAVVVANPEVSSVRDSDRILGILQSKSRKAERGERVIEHLLITRYNPERVAKGEMLGVKDVEEILATKLLGVIPECETVLKASNQGTPVIYDTESKAGKAYSDAVGRLLGETLEHRYLTPEHKSLFQRLFRRSA
jgi:septum site-determining protein MinD